MTDYKVTLEAYTGPLDLLLYLIRREEIDIYNIPIARITQEYLGYVEVLQRLDPDAAGEFLVLAATLMEIKSRTLLPNPPVEEVEEDVADPRLELVRQLLEYKRYKDAARSLEESGDLRSLRHARWPVAPQGPEDHWELDNLEVWALLEAFQRLLDQTGKAGPIHQIPRDDTPIALHADDIIDSLQSAGGTQPFDQVFSARSRAEMIGLFLALLELIRQRRVRASQERPFSPIVIELLDPTPLDAADLDRLYRPAMPEEPADEPCREDEPVAQVGVELEAAQVELSDDEQTDPSTLDTHSAGVIHDPQWASG